MSSLLVNQLYAGGTTSVDTSLLTGTQLTLNVSSTASTSLSQSALSIYDAAGATTVEANEINMSDGTNSTIINNSTPSLFLESVLESATNSATLSASGLTFIGNATLTLGTNPGTLNQVLISGGTGGALSWATISTTTTTTNVYYLFSDVNTASGTIFFSAFSDATGLLTTTLTINPIITLTAVTGADETICVPISINTIDLTANSFTWSASSTVASICATLISRG